MGEINRGGDPDPDLSKSRDGHSYLDLDPTRPDFCRDIFPLETSRPQLLQGTQAIWKTAAFMSLNGGKDGIQFGPTNGKALG